MLHLPAAPATSILAVSLYTYELFCACAGGTARSLYAMPYASHHVQVGYVQGMGFVSAILLMYMSEEEAFWTLVALLQVGQANAYHRRDKTQAG